MNPPFIIHIVASVNPSVGGPARSVPALVRSMAEQGVSTRLLTLDYAEHGSLPALPPDVLHALPLQTWTRPLRGWSPPLARLLDNMASRASLLHNHGLWMFPNHYAARTARRHRLPYVISPRGMLGPWALGRNRLSKKILHFFRERRDLSTASAFHATSEAEAHDIRQAGWRQPIAILPNGVDLPPTHIPPRHAVNSLAPRSTNRRILLFLSRLHPKKGAAELVQAWGRLDPVHRQHWHLIMAGPDLTGYRPFLQSAIRQDRDPDSISLIGAVEGPDKNALLHHADCLALPTKEENFGIVIAEALAHGTPVLTTHSAPWSVLEDGPCGWWIPGTPDDLTATLDIIIRTPPEELDRMGQRGRNYVTRELQWAAIAGKMHQVYQWLLHGGERPGFVHLE